MEFFPGTDFNLIKLFKIFSKDVRIGIRKVSKEFKTSRILQLEDSEDCFLGLESVRKIHEVRKETNRTFD